MTVLLEAGWVLRSLYGLEESAVREAFTKLLGLDNVHVEDEGSVAALALTADGIDPADVRAKHTGASAVSGISATPTYPRR